MNCNTYFDKKIEIKEAICLMETKINELVEMYNRVNANHEVIAAKIKELDVLIDYLIGEGLANEVKKKLEEWLVDGTLAGIINETLFNELNNKILSLQKLGVYTTVEYFGAIGNGITDDTEAFSKAINSNKNIVLDKSKTYKLTQPLPSLKDNQIFNGSNAKIIFDYDMNRPHSVGQTGRINTVGIFDITGIIDSAQLQIDKTKLEYINNGLLYVPTANLIEGEYVQLVVSSETPSTTWLGLRKTIICRITQVLTDHIVVDYNCDKELYDYSLIASKSPIAYINKITPAKNITIENINIEDITPLRGGFTSSTSKQYPDADSHYACCGISIKTSVDIKVKNFHIKNNLYSGVYTRLVHNGLYENIKTDKSKLFGPGEGYNIQITKSMKCSAKKLQGLSTRHTLDFTDSAFCIADEIMALNNKSAEVQFHGNFEHNIEVKGINGGKSAYNKFNAPSINLGSGLANFGNSNMSILIKDSNIKINTPKEIILSSIRFENCSIQYLAGVFASEFDKCSIYFEDTGAFSGSTVYRNTNYKTNMKFINSKLLIPSAKNITITGYDFIDIINSEIKRYGNEQGDTLLVPRNIANFKMINTNSESITIRPDVNQNIKCLYQVINSEVLGNSGIGGIQVRTINGTAVLRVLGSYFPTLVNGITINNPTIGGTLLVEVKNNNFEKAPTLTLKTGITYDKANNYGLA